MSMCGDASRRCLGVLLPAGEMLGLAHDEAAERRWAVPRADGVALPRASLIRDDLQRRIARVFSLACPPEAMLSIWGIDYRAMHEAGDALCRRPTSGKASRSMRTNSGPFGGRLARHFHQAFRAAATSGGNCSTRPGRLLHRVRPVQGGITRGASRADANSLWLVWHRGSSSGNPGAQTGNCPG